MSDIWAIILAAGESRRMGVPKMLLPFNGSTMIETVIRNVTHSNVSKILVVLGEEKDAIYDKIGKLNLTCCYNENYKEGMLSSVQCGLKNLPPLCKASLVFQGDQPLIPSETINAVIKAYASSEKGIVIPVYEKKRGHPILIDMKYRNDIDNLSPGDGLRSLSYMFPADVLEVDTNESGILRDFDTYEQYTKGINIIK